MTNPSNSDADMPTEIDFSNGIRGIHHIPAGARVFVPASIERGELEYFSERAAQRGMNVSEVLQRDIEINEALR